MTKNKIVEQNIVNVKKKGGAKKKTEIKINKYSLMLVILLSVRNYGKFMIFQIRDLWLDDEQTVIIQGSFYPWLRNIEKKNTTCMFDVSMSAPGIIRWKFWWKKLLSAYSTQL